MTVFVTSVTGVDSRSIERPYENRWDTRSQLERTG